MVKPKSKILIVEDEVTLLEMYRLVFEKEGFEVEVAEDGFDSTLKVEKFQPNLILLDIMMPQMDGYEALKILKTKVTSNCKIIVFSNLSNSQEIEKAKKLGIDGYIVKANLTPKEVVKKVKDILKQ